MTLVMVFFCAWNYFSNLYKKKLKKYWNLGYVELQ